MHDRTFFIPDILDTVYKSLHRYALINNILIKKIAVNPGKWSRLLQEDLSSFYELDTGYYDEWNDFRGSMILHDQEPMMYQNQKNIWDRFIFSRSSFDDRFILLHSELNSREIDYFCRDYNAIPVHWFSNGALAYYWYIGDQLGLIHQDHIRQRQIEYKFSCLNRLIGQQRVYRPVLSAMLESTIDHSDLQLSCNLIDLDSSKHALDLVKEYNVPDHQLKYLKKFINKKERISINVDEPDLGSKLGGNNLGSQLSKSYFNKSFCHIATETMFYEDTLHLTEKSLRAFVCMRPMILVGPAGSLAYLRNYGFKTFGEFWDESYDEERDPHKRLDKIFNLISDINKMSLDDMHVMLLKMEDILLYNRNHFFNEFPNVIYRELVKNIDVAFEEYRKKKPNGWTIKRLTSLTKKEFEEIKNISKIPDDVTPLQVFEDLKAGDRSSQDASLIRFLHQYLGLTDDMTASGALKKIHQILC